MLKQNRFRIVSRRRRAADQLELHLRRRIVAGAAPYRADAELLGGPGVEMADGVNTHRERDVGDIVARATGGTP